MTSNVIVIVMVDDTLNAKKRNFIINANFTNLFEGKRVCILREICIWKKYLDYIRESASEIVSHWKKIFSNPGFFSEIEQMRSKKSVIRKKLWGTFNMYYEVCLVRFWWSNSPTWRLWQAKRDFHCRCAIFLLSPSYPRKILPSYENET